MRLGLSEQDKIYRIFKGKDRRSETPIISGENYLEKIPLKYSSDYSKKTDDSDTIFAAVKKQLIIKIEDDKKYLMMRS